MSALFNCLWNVLFVVIIIVLFFKNLKTISWAKKDVTFQLIVHITKQSKQNELTVINKNKLIKSEVL